MNFSKNTKLCKILTLTLALAMVCTLTTGCFGGKTEETEPSTEPDINLNLSETTLPPETEPSVPETTEPNENMATVLSTLTMRSSPSTDATAVGTLQAGDRVEITRRETVHQVEWGYIISPTDGWICMDYVEMDFEPDVPVNSTETPAGETKPQEDDTKTDANTNIKGVINANGLNIREEAAAGAKIVGSYNKGDVVTILETKDGWGRTNKGWVKMDYVNTTANNNTQNNTTNNTNKDNETTNNNTQNNTAITGNGNTTVQFKGIVTASELNIRASASTNGERLGMYTYGDRVEFLEKDGTWGRTNKGWISLNYVYQDGATGTHTATGTITAGGGLNIRSGPGTGYGTVGTYAEGTTVKVLEQFTYNGTKWGCTNKGWISMKYVDVDGQDDNTDDDDGVQTKVTGTVTGNGLRIREGAGTKYDVVGSYNEGDEVTILDQKTVDGTTWGKTNLGWISMDYVDVD